VQSQILAADYAWGKGDTDLAIEILDKIDCSEAWARYYVEGLRSLITGDLKKSFEAYNKIDDVFAANRAVDVAFWGSDSAGMFNASEKLQNKVIHKNCATKMENSQNLPTKTSIGTN